MPVIEEPKLVHTQRPYRVLVIGGGFEYIRMLFQLSYTGAKTPDEADIFLFTGGEDVDPRWYDEKPMRTTFSNIERDRMEKVLFDMAVEKGIPMIGICRGGQFLNVMNGGRMWQHVNNHGGQHDIIEVLPKKTVRKPRRIRVTSTHHQMMIPHEKAEVLAIGITDKGNSICTERASYGKEVASDSLKHYPDYEVLYYPETHSLCFQPHPEFGNAPKECTEYFDELVENFILPHA